MRSAEWLVIFYYPVWASVSGPDYTTWVVTRQGVPVPVPSSNRDITDPPRSLSLSSLCSPLSHSLLLFILRSLPSSLSLASARYLSDHLTRHLNIWTLRLTVIM